MSPDQLRSIFHVEHADLVPNYEVVELQHHAPESSYHHLRKRAIRTGSFGDEGGHRAQLFDVMEKVEPNHEGRWHGKKDLSKNGLFGSVPVNSDKPSANKFSVEEKSRKQMLFSGNDQVAVSEVWSSEGVHVDSNLKDDVVVNVDGETGRLDAPLPRNHNVSLKAFGEQLHLRLTPTEGLFKHGGPHTLRMWTVKPNPNASQGLDYEEVIEVS